VLENYTPPTKLKLSALWTSTMFCYVYGDFFSLYVPKKIERIMEGQSGVGDTTPLALLSFALLMTIPSVMITLSLMLKPALNRWLNISMGVFFTLIMALILVTSFAKEWMMFYSYLAAVEIVLTSAIVWVAWKWQTVIQE
jgi:hypothetical protein